MTRAWTIAGCLVPAACFFQPMLGADEGTSTGAEATGVPTSTSGGVDSESEATGAPTTTLSDETGAVCGDFNVEGAEQCDNGAGNNGGGSICREDCTLNACGDDYLAAAVEGCDDGNLMDGDGCSGACELEGCGDGVKDGREECDDGDQDDADECNNLCHLPVCGDGVVNPSEACDDGDMNGDAAACLTNCQVAVCGDGFVQDGVEACDDGNSVDDDGCDNTCTGAGTCGDGVIQKGEACDDANQVETDACLSSCELATCGDGFVQAGEEVCDFGADTPTCTGCVRSGFYVFVSSAVMSGKQVQGLAQADTVCTQLAGAVDGLEGTYKAWLGDGDVKAAERLHHSVVPYVLPNGTKVADNWNDFASGVHKAPINHSEDAVLLPNPPPTQCNASNAVDAAVWTGSPVTGDKADDHCNGWASDGPKGQGGLFTAMDAVWSGCDFNCNVQARLYCVEQPPA